MFTLKMFGGQAEHVNQIRKKYCGLFKSRPQYLYFPLVTDIAISCYGRIFILELEIDEWLYIATLYLNY